MSSSLQVTMNVLDIRLAELVNKKYGKVEVTVYAQEQQ